MAEPERRWPRIDLYRTGGLSNIKVLSSLTLDRLMSKAAESRWSAEGRQEWFKQHCDQFRFAMLTVFGSEGSGVHRCIATVVLTDGSGGRFTLDVSVSDFDALNDLDDQAVVILAHRYLAAFPALDLDDAQAKTWDESVWKKWGEG